MQAGEAARGPGRLLATEDEGERREGRGGAFSVGSGWLECAGCLGV